MNTQLDFKTTASFPKLINKLMACLTSITMNPGAVTQCRMLAQNGVVVMTSANTIEKP